MEFLKKFFSGKAFGYYVTLAVSLLFLISGIVYVVQYAKDTPIFSVNLRTIHGWEFVLRFRYSRGGPLWDPMIRERGKLWKKSLN